MPQETTKAPACYRFAGFELTPASRTLTAGGSPVALQQRVFDLLLFLVRNPGRLLTKEEILKSVWGDVAVAESNLTQSIFLLRKALAGTPTGGALIVTVPGRGYQLAADVEEISHPNSHTAEQPAERPAPAPSSRNRPIRYAVAIGVAAAALVAILGAAIWWIWSPRAIPGNHSAVVLADFEDATGEQSFEKALNVALAIDLKQTPYLEVASDAKTRKTLSLMEHSPQEKLTPALAREVCQRIGAQAVLAGMIARFGQKYLVTLAASDCDSGQDLVQTKATANQRDDVPDAVDQVASQMRRRLGEPLRSLSRFNKPLLAKRTGSLDALKAYTQGHELGAEGKYPESIPFFKMAVELDPNFAIAWGDLGVVYSNLGEPSLSAAASHKAYQLRDSVDERDSLFITATYYGYVTGDLHESIRTYELWTETYARDTPPWANLANAQTQIGRPDLSIAPAKHALELDSSNAVAYVILSRAQMRAGQLDQALATCQQAIVHKVDGADLHGVMLSIAFARGEQAAINEQIAWARGTSAEPYMTLQQFLMTFAQGRPKAAIGLLTKMTDGYRVGGMQERANRLQGGLPRLEAELGMTGAAKKLLGELPLVNGSIDMPVAMAETGDVPRAEAILRKDLKEFPEDTLWRYVNGPEIEAAIALSGNKAEEAIEALRPAIPYDNRSSELPSLRGKAYLAARQFAAAEAEFHKITDHPTVDPLSPNVALAHLGLARARAGQGNQAGSREEYEQFFALWKDAEPDVPVLQEARSEYGRLEQREH